MNERDRLDAIFNSGTRISANHIDKRPWWVRLLASLKLDLKLGGSLKKPIKSVMLKGKVEF
jgi:hypothetical protein